jgi:hypothetical protein
MRIKSFLSLVFVLLVLVGIAIVPWIDGMMVKRHYENFISAFALQADKRVKIKIVEYHQGWLTSQAKISVTTSIDNIGLPPAPNQQAASAYFIPTIILDQTITHGPLVRNPVTDQYSLGLASIESNVRLPATIEALFLGNQAGTSNGVVTLRALMTFGGDYLTQVRIPVFNISIPGVGQFVWQGLNGSINYYTKGNEIAKIKTDIVVGAIESRSEMGSLVSKEATIKSDMGSDVSGLWDGFSALSIPEFTVVTPNGVFSIKNVNLTNTFNIVAKGFYSAKLQLAIGQLSMPMFSIDQSSMNLSSENINADALAKILTELSNYHSGEMTQQQVIHYINLVPSLITPTSLGQNNVLINTSNGKLTMSGQVSWSAAVKTIDDMVKNLHAKEDIRISVALVNQIIDMTMQGEAVVEQNLNAPTEQNLLKQITFLGDSNRLDLSVGIQLKDLVQAHVDAVVFAKSVDQFVKLKQLDPSVAEQLKSQYVLVKNNAGQAPAPIQPKLSPADAAKQQIAELIKKGYIQQDKDDYITTLTLEQGKLKANGVEVQ